MTKYIGSEAPKYKSKENRRQADERKSIIDKVLMYVNHSKNIYIYYIAAKKHHSFQTEYTL